MTQKKETSAEGETFLDVTTGIRNRKWGEEEYNQALDGWMAERNAHTGESYDLQIGIWPPPKDCYEVQNIEWVTTDWIRRYVDAISDYKNPLWRSEDYAKNTIWGGTIAPPMFLDAIAPTFVDPYADLMSPDYTHPRPPGLGALPAGSRIKFFHVIHPGDRIRVTDTLMGVEEKNPARAKEKGYRLFLEVTKRTYTNQRDEIVAVADSPIIRPALRPGGQTSRKDTFPERERFKYTQEYLDTIYRAYDEEKPRGAETLFWEDIADGEELPTIVAGPLDANDCAVYMGAVGFNGTFAYKYFWNKVQPGLNHYPKDPITGDYTGGARSHMDNEKLRGERPYGWGGQAWGMLCRLITNWMGDDGFLKYYDTRMSRMWYFEDTSWMKGKVAKKYVEGDEHLVDLELRIETESGFVYPTGNATVRLPARSSA